MKRCRFIFQTLTLLAFVVFFSMSCKDDKTEEIFEDFSDFYGLWYADPYNVYDGGLDINSVGIVEIVYDETTHEKYIPTEYDVCVWTQAQQMSDTVIDNITYKRFYGFGKEQSNYVFGISLKASNKEVLYFIEYWDEPQYWEIEENVSKSTFYKQM